MMSFVSYKKTRQFLVLFFHVIGINTFCFLLYMEESKHISITFCDDCIDWMEVDKKEDDSKIIRHREGMYSISFVLTMAFLAGMFYWTYVVMANMDTIEGND